ncbi:hypothetical protein [Deinococcus hohokamensis]|uniref:Uncharacterized protein n=1 Tax=Deinococcus hohokamensis TaxID=309883 RepID=A0ABV9IB55_9DEIO
MDVLHAELAKLDHLLANLDRCLEAIMAQPTGHQGLTANELNQLLRMQEAGRVQRAWTRDLMADVEDAVTADLVIELVEDLGAAIQDYMDFVGQVTRTVKHMQSLQGTVDFGGSPTILA